MFVSAINRVPSVFYGRDDHPMHEPVIAPRRHNPVAMSGGLALAFLGATAVTGMARARIPHVISSILAIGAALFHVQSLAVKNNSKVDYPA